MAGRDFTFASPQHLVFSTMPNNFSSFAMCVSGARDPDIWQFISRRLRPGDIFVDAGANIGTYSVPAALLVGDRGRVVAFEAHPTTYAHLARSIEANGLRNVDAHHLALAAEPGCLEISFNQGNPGETHVADGTGTGVRVAATTLDIALAKLGIDAIDYLKVDVEGFELPVLQGARGIIGRSPHIAVQTEMQAQHAARYAHGLEEIEALLRGLGLAPHHVTGAGEVRPLAGELRGDIIWSRP